MKWNKPNKITQEVNVELSEYNPLIRQILFERGIRTQKEADDFLNVDWSQIYDPFDMHDMITAVERIEEAIEKEERIFIHGDFDVDGICATAILWEYLYNEMEANVLPYIPSRVDEGYGMSEKSLNAILKKKGELVITVDCGVRDVDLVKEYTNRPAHEGKLDFVITDHHEFGDKIPPGVSVVHPLHPKGNYPFKYISGAAVAWKLIAALESRRKGGKLKWEDIPGLDLVAFSTVCDIMPLTDENRVFVKKGLDAMRNSERVGLRSMAKEAGVDLTKLEAYHLGFVLGPRINAAGRIGDAMDALRLLTTHRRNSADQLADKLGKLNRERQDLTDDLVNEVREQIESEGTGKHLYFAHGNDWPEGIVGLVAGKIQEEFNKPVIVVTTDGKSARGSARSISAFNIIQAIESCGDLLVKFGGHKQAAGFTVEHENIESFKKKLQEIAKDQLKKEHFVSEITADALVDAGELDWEVYDLISDLRPFGYGNRTPVFWIEDATIVEVIGLSDNKHVKLIVKGNSSGFLTCIFFGGGDWIMKLAKGDKIDLIGKLDQNEWNGQTNLQFKVKDISKKS